MKKTEPPPASLGMPVIDDDDYDMSANLAIWRAEWAAKRHLHGEDCLERDGDMEHGRPSAGACGRHIFPGEEVVVFVSPSPHMKEYYPDSDHAANFIVCKDCAPTFRERLVAYYKDRAGTYYGVGDRAYLTVTINRCQTCGYH